MTYSWPAAAPRTTLRLRLACQRIVAHGSGTGRCDFDDTQLVAWAAAAVAEQRMAATLLAEQELPAPGTVGSAQHHRLAMLILHPWQALPLLPPLWMRLRLTQHLAGSHSHCECPAPVPLRSMRRCHGYLTAAPRPLLMAARHKAPQPSPQLDCRAVCLAVQLHRPPSRPSPRPYRSSSGR